MIEQNYKIIKKKNNTIKLFRNLGIKKESALIYLGSRFLCYD